MGNENFYYRELEENDEEFASGYDRSGTDSGADDDSLDFKDSDLCLGFINFIGTELDGINQYELIFTLYPDEFWGENFNYKPAGICNGLEPERRYVQKVVRIKTVINLDLIQDSGCFSMQDCMDGIVSLAYQDLAGLDEYPEYRLYLMFGEKYDEVERKLAMCHILMGGV
jgi:hypothetical protein